MNDLTRLFRPQRYDDVVGQVHVVKKLRSFVCATPATSVCLAGPPGTGKSTLATLYGRAILCLERQNGEACGHCMACAALQKSQNLDYLHHRGGEDSGVAGVLNIIEFLKRPPRISAGKAVLIEEAKPLSRRSTEALLEITENPPEYATFILASSEADKLPGDLRRRLRWLETRPLDALASQNYLSTVCNRVGLAFEQEGLALIHAENAGVPGLMLRSLEDVMADAGSVTLSNVRSALRLNVFSYLEQYTEGLMLHDLARQLEIFDQWIETPSQKLSFLHRFFVDVFLAYERGLCGKDPLFADFTMKTGSDFTQVVEARAAALAQSPANIWKAIIDHSTPSLSLTPWEVRMRLTRINDLLQHSEPTFSPRHKRVFWTKPRLLLPEVADGAYMEFRQIETTFRAASFLPLQYGALFNVRVSLFHRGTSEADHHAAGLLISKITHQLAGRFVYWQKDMDVDHALHWMFQHEANTADELTTRLVLSVPQVLRQKTLRWLNRFLQKKGRSDELRGPKYRVSYRTSGDLRFHWSSIRVLCRSIDPKIVTKRNDVFESLADILNIAAKLRHQNGHIKCPKSRGSSETLASLAQTGADQSVPVICAFDDHAWSQIDTGWELHEWFDRRKETDRREKLRLAIAARFPNNDDASIARKAEELLALEDKLSLQPMRRSWQYWRQTSTK